MKCEDLLRAINEYVDGAIDPATCDELEKHLAGCDPCQIVVDNIRKTITLYRGEDLYELPPELEEKLAVNLRERWRQLRGGGEPPRRESL